LEVGRRDLQIVHKSGELPGGAKPCDSIGVSSHMGTVCSHETDDPEALIAWLRRDGQTALAELFDRCAGQFRRMICARLDGRAAARVDPSDVIQEAYLDASRQLRAYLANPNRSPVDWLRFLTNRRLLAELRRHLGTQKRDARREVALGEPAMPDASWLWLSQQVLDDGTSPSMKAIRKETVLKVEEMLSGMGPLDREILAIRLYHGQTNGETAEALGISPSAASKRYARAVARLKECLACPDGDVETV